MCEKQAAQDGGTDASFEIGVVEVVSQQASELLGDVFPLPASEGEDSRPIRRRGPLSRCAVRLAMPGQEVEDFNRIRVWQRSLLLEIFASQFVTRLQVGVAKGWARRIKDARPETGQSMFQGGREERVVWRPKVRDLAIDAIRQSPAGVMEKASGIFGG